MRLLEQAAATAARYLEELDRRGVAPTPEALAALAGFDEPLPEHPTEADRVLETLDRIGSPATMGMAGRRYFGFVIGGSLPAALAANWLAGAWDQCPGLFAASPVGTVLEEVALGWLLDALRLPAGSGGAFVTGATVANFTALAAARHHVLAAHGWDVEADGLFGAPPITVVVGAEAHPSVIKALGMLGLGRTRLRQVPVDDQGRMIATQLPGLGGPAIVCIQAGNVNTGAFDPAAEICRRAHDGGAWVHVDGAFGLWAAASPSHAHLVAGVADADSWATDAHKWLNVPYDSGLAFVREGAALKSAMSLSAAYLPQGRHREPSQYTPELSRRARGVEVWAALKSLGRTGLADLIERTCGYARRFAETLGQAGCEILNEVVLNQVLVSFGDRARTLEVIERVQRDGTCWCGPTEWQGRTAMRISVSSWATTEEDVDRSAAAILRAAGSEAAELFPAHPRTSPAAPSAGLPSSGLSEFIARSSTVHWLKASTDGRIVAANRAFELLFHGRAEELAGLSVWDRLTEPDAATLKAALDSGIVDPGEALVLNFVDPEHQVCTLECRLEPGPGHFDLLGEPVWQHDRALAEELMDLNNRWALLARENERTVKELRRAKDDLQKALADLNESHWHLRKIQETLPICMYCGNVKTSEAKWESVAQYLKNNSLFLTHGCCPNCLSRLQPDHRPK